MFQVAGLAMSLFLNLKLPGIRIFRTIMFLPAVLSGVAVAVLWLQLLNDNGAVNQILRALGVADPPLWLISHFWAVPAVIIIGVWGVGTGAIIYLSGLQNIPPQLYEQARIDGAGPIRSFFSVTLPLLTPTLLFTVLTGHHRRLPGVRHRVRLGRTARRHGRTRCPSTSSMSGAKRSGAGRFGYASALAWVFVVVAAALIVVILRTSDRWVFDESGGEG